MLKFDHPIAIIKKTAEISLIVLIVLGFSLLLNIFPSSIFGLLGLLLVIACTILFIKRPFYGLLAILIAITVSGYSFEIGPSGIGFASGASSVTNTATSVRLEHVLIPLAFLALLIRNATKGQLKIYLGRGIWLIFFILVNLLSSILFSQNISYSLRMNLFYIIGLMAFLFIANFVHTEEDLKLVFKYYFIVAGIEAIFSLIAGGRWYENGLTRIHGSLVEPVIFGNFMLAATIFYFAYLGWSFKYRRIHLGMLLLFSLFLIASLLSFSRGTILGIMAGVFIILLLWLKWRLPIMTRVIIPSGLILILTATLLFCLALISSGNKFTPLTSRLTENTYLTRFVTMQRAFENIAKSPFLGHGTFSYGFTYGVTYNENLKTDYGWAMNGSLIMLNDTGIVGFTLFVIFLLSTLADCLRSTKSQKPFVRYMAAGGLAVLIGLVLVEQFSTSVTTGFFWSYFGLIAAINRIGRQKQTLEL